MRGLKTSHEQSDTCCERVRLEWARLFDSCCKHTKNGLDAISSQNAHPVQPSWQSCSKQTPR
eukprot:5043294-Amphidinium_carterae.1